MENALEYALRNGFIQFDAIPAKMLLVGETVERLRLKLANFSIAT